MPTTLITCHHLQRSFGRFRSRFEELGVTPILPEIAGQQLDSDAMAELMIGVDAVIAGDDVIDETVLEVGRGSGLKAVIKWGIGTDAIDLSAAARLGIPVFNTPGMFAEEVADLAMIHLLTLARGAHRMHRSIVEGGWLQVKGRSLAGMEGGIIGLGSIGSAIARRMAAVGMGVSAYDVREIPPEDHGVPDLRQVRLEELLARSDAIVVACHLTPSNRHLLSDPAFEMMKQGVLIVNVSRGPLIDQDALVTALGKGTVAGAGLDVFEDEPLPADDDLRKHTDRCFFTAHSGSNTLEAVERTNQLTTDILFDVLGVRSIHGVTPNRVA